MGNGSSSRAKRRRKALSRPASTPASAPNDTSHACADRPEQRRAPPFPGGVPRARENASPSPPPHRPSGTAGSDAYRARKNRFGRCLTVYGRKTVLGALASDDWISVRPAVLSHLSDPHWSVRKSAADILKHRRDPATDPILERMAAEDPDTTVRQAARDALGR